MLMKMDVNNSLKKRADNWKTKCSIKHNYFFSYDKSNYTGSKNMVVVTCPKHGDFSIRADRHVNGQGCKICNGWKKDADSFIHDAKLVHGDLYDYCKVKYVSAKDKVIIICSDHGEFLQTPDNHLQGKGCPKCAINLRAELKSADPDDFLSMCNEKHMNFYTYDKNSFIGWNHKMKIFCPDHGEFHQRASAHLNGQGCPKCTVWKNELRLFQKLQKTFPNLHIISQYSPEWLYPQRFDIAIPELSLAIEYNGIQHYEFTPFFHRGGEIDFNNQLQRDIKKRDKCLMNNYKLVELKYDYIDRDFHNLEKLIYDLNVEKNEF